MRTYHQRLKELNELLGDNESERPVSRSMFYRVFALVATSALVTVPLIAFQFYIFIAKDHVQPYVSWSDVHKNFSEVVAFTTEQVDAAASENTATMLMRDLLSWVYVVCAAIFLAIFGTSKGVFWFYADLFWGVARKLRIARGRKSSSVTTVELTAVVFTSFVAQTENGSFELHEKGSHTL